MKDKQKNSKRNFNNDYLWVYIPCDQPARKLVKMQQTIPPTCLGYRKWHAMCHNSRSICHGSTNSMKVKQRMSLKDSHRRLDKFPWLCLTNDPSLAWHDENLKFCLRRSGGGECENKKRRKREYK